MRLMSALRWACPVLVIIAVALTGGTEQAAILTVCPHGCQFAKIQEAIEAASEGDSIQIGAGIYRENLVIKKRVTLGGISLGEVFLTALDQGEPTVLLKETRGVVMSQISISGSIAIQGEGAVVSLLNNKIIASEVGIKLIALEAEESTTRGNELISSGQGIGILLLGRGPFLIRDNSITGLATGMVVGGAVVCDIRSNRISGGWDGLVIGSISSAIILGHQIMGNHRDGVVLGGAAAVEISGNEIRENDG